MLSAEQTNEVSDDRIYMPGEGRGAPASSLSLFHMSEPERSHQKRTDVLGVCHCFLRQTDQASALWRLMVGPGQAQALDECKSRHFYFWA